jgi:peptidoglycan LD-endopeptidase LytH
LKRRKYILPEPKRKPRAPREGRPIFVARYWKHLFWIAPLILADLLIFHGLKNRGAPTQEAIEESPLEPVVAAQVSVAASPWKKFVFPTAQTRLLEDATADIFQPTASGNPESSLYGSVRTAKNGEGLMSSFHEGIDIAATQRDRHGRPMDAVHAVADGVVGYVNRIGGNSNYGIYVVLLHNDPVGEVYTLYAHLAEVPTTLRAGRNVSEGETIGLMGNTSSAGIPMSRAHLHFEIGLIDNQRFASWYRAHKLKPDHGNFHGRNFFGVDPRKFIASRQRNPNLVFRSHLAALPPAFELVVAAPKQPDFFHRYPSLWSGPDFDGTPIVLSCSENGLPLEGRRSNAAERQAIGKQKCVVLKADEAVLGRNGCHLIAKTSRGWKLGSRGSEWLEILTY